jgi:uncharacterized repeat protein (TIGR02543 family)
MGRWVLNGIRIALNRIKRVLDMIKFWDDMVKAGAGLHDGFKLMVGDPYDKGVKYIDLGDLIAYIKNSLEDYLPGLPTTYWVTYDSAGGSEVAGSPFLTEDGSEHTVREAPEKAGHVFVQWECRYELATGPMIDYYNPGDTIGVYRNLTLRAIWAEEGTNIPQYIYFGYRMPGETSSFTSDNCVVGELYTIIDFDSERLPFGKVFTGWSYEGAIYQPGQSIIFPASPSEVYFTAVLADAVPNSHTVTFLSGGINVSGMPNPSNYTVVVGEEYDIQDYNPSRLGYDFDGWVRDDTEELIVTSFVMPDNDVTLTARWTARIIDLYYSVDGEQEFWGDAPCGSMVTVRPGVPTKQGYVFQGWMDDSLMTLLQPGEQFEMPFWTVTLVARFERSDDAIGFIDGNTVNVDSNGTELNVGVWKGSEADIGECYVFSDVDWMEPESSLIIWDRGNEERTVDIQVQANTGPERTGIITIDPAGTEQDELTIHLTVVQGAGG